MTKEQESIDPRHQDIIRLVTELQKLDQVKEFPLTGDLGLFARTKNQFHSLVYALLI